MSLALGAKNKPRTVGLSKVGANNFVLKSCI